MRSGLRLASKFIILTSLVSAGPLAATALAVPIDFTQPGFSGANWASSFEINAGGLDLRFDPLPTPSARLYWDNIDGFGVRYSYEADEVEAEERLKLTFTSGPVHLSTVFLTDIFYEGDPRYFETGSYELNGTGDWFDFVQTNPAMLPSPTSNGLLTLVVNAPDVTSIAFRAPGRVNGQNHEFSVAGIDIISVPEPNSVPEPMTLHLVLLGSGFLGALVRRRRRTRP